MDPGDELIRRVQGMDWLLEKYGADAVMAASEAAEKGASLEEQRAIMEAMQ